ncbi:hypothetical protein EJ110_NYTH33814 [Nymphaea thermarum]|nr:hypothetical protein EJ110_NYTH33814 [Nymphaea thermarum]
MPGRLLIVFFPEYERDCPDLAVSRRFPAVSSRNAGGRGGNSVGNGLTHGHVTSTQEERIPASEGGSGLLVEQSKDSGRRKDPASLLSSCQRWELSQLTASRSTGLKLSFFLPSSLPVIDVSGG